MKSLARVILERYELMEQIKKDFPYSLHIIEKLEIDGHDILWEERWDTNKPLPIDEERAKSRIQAYWLKRVV